MDFMNKCCFCDFPLDRVDYLMIQRKFGVSICVHCAENVIKAFEVEKQRDYLSDLAKSEFYEHFGTDI